MLVIIRVFLYNVKYVEPVFRNPVGGGGGGSGGCGDGGNNSSAFRS